MLGIFGEGNLILYAFFLATDLVRNFSDAYEKFAVSSG